MLQKFIDNPVLSTVISIIIVILGLLGLWSLPISQYPDIAPPIVEVSTSYPGANADAVMKSVLMPLEEQINGVEHMSYMSSKASNDGSATITVIFKQGTDPDLAAVNVQNRVAKATSLLPAEVIKNGVTTTKTSLNFSTIIYGLFLYSENPAYDKKWLDNYLKINVVPGLKRIEGISDAQFYADKEYSMRIWLQPEKMAAYSLAPSDIIEALADQNIEAAPGKIGESSQQTYQYALRYTGRLETPEQFSEIVIRAAKNGEVLRLKDVATVEMGAITYTSSFTAHGKPSSYVAIFQTPGSNSYALIQKIEEQLQKAAVSFPEGVKLDYFENANKFLDASIEKLVHTIVEAFLLVFVVVFIFLQDLRSTLIPAIAVPVAVIGTFFFLKLFGFSLNMLTLFALVMAIGIVVDDAIVVVEAVHTKLGQGARSAKKATMHAMNEISTAIVSITLVMTAVFIPVTFIAGSAGVFYKQFGLTLAVAIIISAVNALTLSPALCALLLKPHQGQHKAGKPAGFLRRFYAAFNTAFAALTSKYISAVRFLIRKKWLAWSGLAMFSLLLYFLLSTTPKGFVPDEDSGGIYGNVLLPPSTTLQGTQKIADEIDSIAQTIPEIALASRVAGMDLISGTGSSYGAFFFRLQDWKKRTGEGQDIKSIINKLFEKTAHIKGGSIIFFAAPTLAGFGNTTGFEFQLQDKTDGSYAAFGEHISRFLTDLKSHPEIMYAETPFNISFPRYQVAVNAAKCMEAGVKVKDVLNTLQGYLGGIYASDFNRFGKQYKVMIQAAADDRADMQDLDKIFVKNNDGEMAPISAFVTLTKEYGPEFINRFNLFTSASVTGAPNAGYSSGDAIRAIQETAQKTLPAGYDFEFSGLAREEITSGSQSGLIFMLCLVFIYFLLSAQFKSYLLPFAILLTLPVGLSGSFLFVRLFGLNNNIFLQISLIMLIGLLAKNAILIVEFSLQHRRSGNSLVQSALNGAKARLRPILMTSFAFIFGMLPLMFSTGAGALSNRSIGTAAVGGMLVGTVFGVLIIPVLFILFQALQERLSIVKEENINTL